MAGLAASDSFTVESFHNGTHYTYVISIKDGIPVTMHLGSMPTTEANGMKMSIDVELGDIEAYMRKAEMVYKYFTHKPNFNIDTLDTEVKELVRIAPDWCIEEVTFDPKYKNMNLGL